MEPEFLLRTARELIDEIAFCFAITIGDEGVANARLVQPLKPRDDWSVQFLTNRRCRKVREIEKSGRMTLAYHRESDPSYVCLIGRASIVEDVKTKHSIWSPAAERWNPGGPDDPAVVFARLETERIELWSATRHILPEPEGYSAAVLIRSGSGWTYSAT